MGVPILSGQALVGVMELFSAEPIATNQEFLVAIQVISTRIEQYLQRKTAERQLLAHQQTLERSKQELLVAHDHSRRQPDQVPFLGDHES